MQHAAYSRAHAHTIRVCDCAVPGVQLMISLAVLVGRFKVALAPQMGGWQGCHDREANAFTLQLIGGNWLVFTPRDAADKDEDFLIRARHSVHCSEP